ncbi:hypothetical protein [Actinomadura rubrisoli]|uniref:hypothetical protein n=1 Tax=Actinomadura rubrisoli TaxID=2530368 RepID=UPI0014043916|nr:hypothetical protein [Actinomadura rubrisoli]
MAARESGGLVVLAACVSDLPDLDHDEALTPATMFLAAGAVDVIGALHPPWVLSDHR